MSTKIIPAFSFISLVYNEEMHLPRLLRSIKNLGAPIYVLDSGSTDRTLEICKENDVFVNSNAFENHPKQWDFALKNFPINTPWIIALDADQIVTPELYAQLREFRDEDHQNINGIYFNRKNYFKGKWIRFGGYYPKYLLKMFRAGIGYSDLNENMDHRFIVPGKNIVWKKGHIIEENLKENKISFWIQKHNRYSDLVAEEEMQRRGKVRMQTIKPGFFGTPDQRIAFLKKIWWKMPLFVRPFIYFFYRYFIRLGILDGKKGLIFHFLQAFWFRFVVDVKIMELKNKQ
jgi:glycosyltransferase involved in cell wall biosynthesis